jgi:hypothetical protein
MEMSAMSRSARSFLIAAATLLTLAGAGVAQAQPAAATDTPRIDARQARQQDRIQAGVADGSLTRAEAHHLQQQQRHIRHAERHAKADGVVTAQERQRLAAMQDHASRSIHRQKHDAQRQPRPAG